MDEKNINLTKASVTITKGYKILMIVSDSNELTPSENKIRNRLSSNGYHVVLSSDYDEHPKDLTSYDGVFISSSIKISNLKNKYKEASKPVIVAAPKILGLMGMTGSVYGTDFGTVPNQTDINIIGPSYFISGILSGVQTVQSHADTFGWGNPGNYGKTIARIKNSAAKSSIFIYESRSKLKDNTLSTNKRAFIWINNTTFYNANETGKSIIDRVFEWAFSNVRNQDFFDGINNLPSFWETGTWEPENSMMTWQKNGGINNSKCISIESVNGNDAWWSQKVNVIPGKGYVVKAMANGENIVGANKGANICQIGEWCSSNDEGSTGTFDWKEISFSFLAPDSGIAEIGCRLGFWGNTVTGKAMFDNVTIFPMTHIQVTNIQLFLEANDLSIIQNNNLKRWVEHLYDAYETYSDLVGFTPYDHKKISILSSRQYPGGWAVAGNPIIWYQKYIKDELKRINDIDDWSFGILHEIGHDFCMDNWNWDSEFWANTKMYYILEVLDGIVTMGNIYTGTELKQYYYKDAENSYLNTYVKGNYSHRDGLTYCFIRISEEIGWKPFKETFRYFINSGENPSTNLDKFNRFLQLLQEKYNPDGNEVENTFLPGELDNIRDTF